MSPVNKEYKALSKYLKNLKERIDAEPLFRGSRLRRLRSARRVVDFYKKFGRWPSRLTKNSSERNLGATMENWLSKTSATFDKNFRRLVMAMGRKTNNKRKHNVQGFKKEILEFIETHSRVPTTVGGQRIQGEARLRSKLDYYTKECNDMTFLGQVYAGDKCHRSGVPARFRAIINEALSNSEKPLIRSV